MSKLKDILADFDHRWAIKSVEARSINKRLAGYEDEIERTFEKENFDRVDLARIKEILEMFNEDKQKLIENVSEQEQIVEELRDLKNLVNGGHIET